MLFYRNNIKLESHNRKIAVQFLNTGKLNNMFLNKPWIEERKKKGRENRKYFKLKYRNVYENRSNATKTDLYGRREERQ